MSQQTANVQPSAGSYSLAERDRRWAEVRRRAAEAGLDGVLVPLGNGTDGRYLTQFRSAGMLLPTDGRSPIVLIDSFADRDMRNDWIPEPRLANRAWDDAMTRALLDAGMERGRIGVVGLKGGTVTHARQPDGLVVHRVYAEIVRRLPNATFTDATDVVGFARYVKSAEEIAFLRQAAAIAEAGIDAMGEEARVGLDAGALYARVTARMLALGSERYPLALSLGPIGGRATRHTEAPLGTVLEAGTLITNEVTAIVEGQEAQEDQPMLLGPIPDAWRPVVDLQREVFAAGLERMRPGTPLGEFIDFVNGFGARRGGKTLILMHGRGYGDDGPLLSPRVRGERVRSLRLEAGTAWVWKPYAMSADERIQFVWGGDVVVTEQGGQVLFQRPHGLISIT
jgi:Xaa-Pro aminopeptidase